jgi:hypothetical protein
MDVQNIEEGRFRGLGLFCNKGNFLTHGPSGQVEETSAEIALGGNNGHEGIKEPKRVECQRASPKGLPLPHKLFS